MCTCSSAIERITRKIAGVQSSEVVLLMNRLTITNGIPIVIDIYSDTLSEEELLKLIIPIEKLSNHQLTKAICDEDN